MNKLRHPNELDVLIIASLLLFIVWFFNVTVLRK